MTDKFIAIDPAWKSSWWRRMLARIFGKRREGRCGTAVVVGYQYRGVFYITHTEL